MVIRDSAKKNIVICSAILAVIFFSCSFSDDGTAVPESSAGEDKSQFYSQSIQVDGIAYDWVNIDPIVTANSQTALTMKTAHDADFLYFCIEGKGMGANYDLLIDSDNDSSTGYIDANWSDGGSDFLVENGFLHGSTGPGWSWSALGSLDVADSANSDVVEIRIKKSALLNLNNIFKIGFRDINSAWTLVSTLPAWGAMISYDLNNGYDITNSSTIMKVLIPAYFEPGSDWLRMEQKAALMQNRIFAIANPNNGPSNQIISQYVDAINSLRNNGGRVIGYVHTLYGSRDIDLVKSDIDKWFAFYNIDGIFLDEQAGTSGKELYYQEIYNYIKSIKPSALVIGNPGDSTVETYLYYKGSRVTDVVCIYEKNKDFLQWSPPAWIYNYSSDNFCALTIGTDIGSWQSFADHAYSVNIGWIYHTDDLLPNPWDILSSYFENLCDYVK